MQFANTLAVAASFVAAPPERHHQQHRSRYFQLMALRSASPVHFSPFQAAKSSIFLQLPSQNASCDDSEPKDAATFYLDNDGGLFLYAASATPQQLYADRSGMGQGKLGYTTGAQPAPRNGERTGFTIDRYGDLTLKGSSFVACPDSIEGSWSVWVSAGIANPAGNTGCLGVSARAVEVAQPDSCTYTQ
ncbi:cell wall protein phiA [Colletotrichum spaethianum]|uniref:Cell wall protein phiA n=1 Tax=Colletotrichum spaethianum TaxID=700344 RepID=A0AA37L3E0_9PEZI|nr:cell wall protein phiA [Colletotrichum spaethianum]GKT40996.1 cell wall protein phiA [Colletotrichum spaethianum]